MRYFVAGNFWLFCALMMILFQEHGHRSVGFLELGAKLPTVIYFGIVGILCMGGCSLCLGGILMTKTGKVR